MRILAGLAFLLLCAAPARAEEATLRIAVLPFDSALGKAYDGFRDGMPDIVTACFTLHASEAVILDRSAVENITAEAVQNFDVKKIKLQSATHLLRGSLAPHDNGMVATLMVYDLAMAKLVASAEASGAANTATVCDAVKALAEPLRLVRSEEAGGADPAAEQRGRLMVEGMGYYYNGAYEKAVPVFMKLAKQEPDSALARYWLGKSYFEASMVDEARIEFEKFLKQFPDDPRRAEVEGYIKKEQPK